MRDNCLTSRHEENRLIPVASRDRLCSSQGCVSVCVWMCDLSVYCTVICFVLLLFLFLFVSYDLSAGLVKLGKSRSLSVSVLVEGCTCHLRCLWQLLRSWVVLQGPPLVLQREYILIGPNVGCSDLCVWNQPPSWAVNLSWVASWHPREVWHSLYLSDDQRLHTASHPHNPDTGRKVYIIHPR